MNLRDLNAREWVIFCAGQNKARRQGYMKIARVHKVIKSPLAKGYVSMARACSREYVYFARKAGEIS